MRAAIAAIALILTASSAFAQLGDLLRRVNPDKIKAGTKAVTAATHEFTEDEEADIGRVVAARVLATYPLASNDRLQKYVTLVGRTVAAYSTRPTLEWHFAVIQTDIVNAFSCPGGYIFVTTGALNQMKSEAELAALLGHEIAHATQKHILKEVKRSNTISAGLDVAKTTSTGSFLNAGLADKVSKIAYEKLFTSGLSRRDEQEADTIGVKMAAAAGYRAAAYVDFLETLQEIEGEKSMSVLTATHPRPADRLGYVKSAAGNPRNGELLEDRWARWTQPSGR
ncbi:MAG: M48 family metalloprotease [Thermoanaerobaculia bacterium]